MRPGGLTAGARAPNRCSKNVSSRCGGPNARRRLGVPEPPPDALLGVLLATCLDCSTGGSIMPRSLLIAAIVRESRP
jgi:hypothetical protein